MEFEDTDLRPYLRALTKRWRWLLSGAMLAALAMLALLQLQPATYTATASLLVFIRQINMGAALDGPTRAWESIDTDARRQGVRALIQSSIVETQLAPEIVAQVAPRQYKPGLLLANKRIVTRINGDLILISATAETPQQAKALADEWARTAARLIEKLLPDRHSSAQVVGEALLPYQARDLALVSKALVAATVGLLAAIVAALVADLRSAPTHVYASASADGAKLAQGQQSP